MSRIRKLRSLRGAGVLANRNARDAGPEFLKFNLIYGFNGSGKSTLSRILACLESGKQDVQDLPEACQFEIEMTDGSLHGGPNPLTGLEKRVCVFNANFVERHLRWRDGLANSIFFISEEQVEASEDLRLKRGELDERQTARTAQAELLRAKDRAFRGFKTARARLISERLHLGQRRYEADQLQRDYGNHEFDENSVVCEDTLNDLEEVASSSSAPPALSRAADESRHLTNLVEEARRLAELSVGQTALAEAERHPSMVPWLKTGHDYHEAHALSECLFCANILTEERRATLAAALDDKLTRVLNDLREVQRRAALVRSSLDIKRWPVPAEIDVSLRSDYARELAELDGAFERARALLTEAQRVLDERLNQPTIGVTHSLPSTGEVAAAVQALSSRTDQVNAFIDRHNEKSADFFKNQGEARAAIKKHYLAEGWSEFATLRDELEGANEALGSIDLEIAALQEHIATQSAKVRTHGPGADKITKLVHAYLGHRELTIFSAEEGYELHRHGRIVRGPPSEGEKTAIALCYFLSKLEEDGRSIDDLIIIIDDPISSLDTKAMNYACSLLRSRIAKAEQAFILTHNQACMNEFKKAWQNLAKARGDKPASAALLFLEVTLPEGSSRRVSELIEMPAYLRGYDSEYHFLCSKALQFEAAGEGYSEIWFMMPNVIRRVLEVFLGFKDPGSHSIQQKLENLSKNVPDLDPIRIEALNRLVQVESHSDNLDDLISHSSMTIEETRDANAALLEFMRQLDAGHMTAIRRQCAAA